MEAYVNCRHIGLDHHFILLEGIFEYRFYLVFYFLTHETVSEARGLSFGNKEKKQIVSTVCPYAEILHYWYVFVCVCVCVCVWYVLSVQVLYSFVISYCFPCLP